MAMTVDILGDSDVSGFQFTIAQSLIACSTGQQQQQTSSGKGSSGTKDAFQTITVTKSLEDLVLPGNVSALENQTGKGRHVFADYFTMLPEGCYDVTVKPMAGTSASADCSSAQSQGVAIEAGKVKEIWLLSQCKGDLEGALDTAITVNHPPTIVKVEYSPSKFVQQCQASQICVRVEDPDGDAIRLEVAQSGGEQLYEPLPIPTTMTRSNGKGFASGGEVCFRLVGETVGDYKFDIKAYDLAADGSTIESGLSQNGGTQTSHTYLQGLPLRVGFQPDQLCWNGSAAVQAEGTTAIQRVNGCSARTAEDYFCSAADATKAGFDLAKTCPGGRFEPKEAYPACR